MGEQFESRTVKALNHADVLPVAVSLDRALARLQPLDAMTVVPWAAEYLADEHLDVTIRDLVREVIERLALSGARRPGVDPPPAPASG